MLVSALCLACYAAFKILYSPIGDLAGNLTALLGLVLLLTYGQQERKSAVWGILLAAVAIQILSWYFMTGSHPAWVNDHPEIDRLAKIFLFLPVAWILSGSTTNTLRIWLLASLAFLATTLVHGGLQDWYDGFHGERVGFGIRNKQHAGMLFGVVLLGWLVFCRRMIVVRARIVAYRLALWGLIFCMLCLGVIFSQTRAVWLALSISLPLLALILFLGARRYERKRPTLRASLVTVAVTAVLAVLAFLLFGDALTDRMFKEHSVILSLLHGDVSNLPYSSIGIRVHSWLAATDWIAERPLTGWGGNGRSLVMDHTSYFPQWVKDQFGHLHNYPIEILVAYGLLGFLVISSLVIWVTRACHLAWKAGFLPSDIHAFAWVFFVYWIIVNQFESYMSFWTGVFVFNLVVGGLVTHYYRFLNMQAAEPRTIQVNTAIKRRS
ncbi:O-antigen ligase family protein [Salinicola sp. MIT1003]|uniref:O-antigen ligase family protein n=1 Tax=Salinicola sp. MIT1003 TaxID=1882734 RepID=UPI0008DE8D0D|nr:O-antigen ligase family protein [Salinicola sp. MIT1003]OHY99605.1 hypothetical protein BC443_08555 [Salinicola sp. MIT1003]